MNSTSLLALFREQCRDTAQPYLWSDSEIFAYMDDAQKMFCRLQGGIADSSSAITEVAVPAGSTFVDYDERILKLREVRLQSDETYRRGTLEILNQEDLMNHYILNDYGYRASSYADLDRLGRIYGVVTGMQDGAMRMIGRIDTDDVLKLVVYRLPLTSLTAEDQALEIPEQHHYHLLLWMQHLGHLKQDAETYDRGRADDFANRFYEYCNRAKHERELREHKYRTVGYGGL